MTHVRSFRALALLILMSCPVATHSLAQKDVENILIGALKGIAHACCLLKVPEILRISQARLPGFLNFGIPVAGLLWGTTGALLPTNSEQQASYTIAAVSSLALILYAYNNAQIII